MLLGVPARGDIGRPLRLSGMAEEMTPATAEEARMREEKETILAILISCYCGFDVDVVEDAPLN